MIFYYDYVTMTLLLSPKWGPVELKFLGFGMVRGLSTAHDTAYERHSHWNQPDFGA